MMLQKIAETFHLPFQSEAPATASLAEFMVEGWDDHQEKWLVQKNQMTFGPYTLVELKRCLEKKLFSGDDVVIDQVSDSRRLIRCQAQLRDYFIHKRISEQKRRWFRIILATTCCMMLFILGSAITSTFWSHKSKSQHGWSPLVDRQQIRPIKGIEVSWLIPPTSSSYKHLRHKRNRRSLENILYAKATSHPRTDIKQILTENFGTLNSCIWQSARQNPTLNWIRFDLNIHADGKINRLEVNGLTHGIFHTCALKRLSILHFPKSPGVTRTSFLMTLNR